MNRTALRTLGRRLLYLPPTVFGVLSVAFVLTRLVPGDPATLISGPYGTSAQLAQIRHQLGTDRPLLHQYCQYLLNATRLDFGTSITTGAPVRHDLAERLPSTIELVLLAMIVGVAVGMSAGAWGGRHANRAPDRVVQLASSAILAIPDFFVGLILIYFAYFRLSWAPDPIGQISTSAGAPVRHITGAALVDSLATGDFQALQSALAHAVLPVLTLSLVAAAPIARITRSAVAETFRSDYVEFARALGLPRRMVNRYALRGALPSVITVSGLLFAGLIGGSVLIEVIFGWGGAAQYAADSIAKGDYPAIQGFVVVGGLISIAVFFLLDIAYVLLDPRIRVDA